jgi:hypothetical protein
LAAGRAPGSLVRSPSAFRDTVRKKYNSSVVQRALTRAHIKGPATRPAPRHIPAAAPAEPFPPQPLAMQAAPVIFFAVLQEGRWPPGPA